MDLRHTLRLLAKDRTFTLTALVTLAVCIAANTAIFSIVRSVLLKPLPVPDSDALVLVYNSYPHAGAARAGAAVPDYYDRLEAVPALVEQALIRRESVTFGTDTGAKQAIAVRATPSFFRMVRLHPAEGRVFTDEEGEPGNDDRVIASYGFWQRELGGDPSVVGQTIRLDGRPQTLVGVAPADYSFLWDDVDLYVPAAFTAEDKSFDRRHSNNWQMIGRLGPGATLNDAQRQIDALNAANDERFPEFKQILHDAGFHTVVVNLQDDLVRDVRAVLYLLWGGVLFVLVIGCVNIANLVLVRSSARAREMATRHAIGANLGRLARQLVGETVVLATAGGAVGLLLGWWALKWISTLNLDQLPRGHEVALDLTSVLVIVALTLAVGLALGLGPALRLSRIDINAELREESRGGTSGRRAQAVRKTLAMAQIGIAFVLLIGAGLLFASFRAVLGLDLGFDPAHVLTTRVSLPAAAYPGETERLGYFERVLDGVRALPDVETAGLTSNLPFTSDHNDSVVLAEGYEMKPGESLISPVVTVVSPGYFETMHVALVSGRLFDATDMAGTTPVVIIDERLAHKWWPDRQAIGRRLYFPTDLKNITAVTADTVFMTVVGVVREIQLEDPRAGNSPVGAYYLPLGRGAGQVPDSMTLTIRTRTDSDAVVRNVEQIAAGLDADLPLYRTGSMQHWIDRTLVARRVPMYLALAFGGVGLLLSAVGIYGVLAYGVAQRRRELGVRMALGGSTRQVFGMVLRDGLRIVATGLALGWVGAYFVGRFMQSLLYGVSPVNPVVLVSVTLVLAGVACVACVIPSWRAARINPVSVLGK